MRTIWTWLTCAPSGTWVLAAVIVLGLAASGCARLETIDKAAEPKVDETYDAAVKRLCRLPLDIQTRAMARHGDRALVAMVAACPEWAAVRDRILALENGIGPNERLQAIARQLIEDAEAAEKAAKAEAEQ